MKLKLIQQGAEAKILLDSSKNITIKDRISKSYRHPNLDNQLRKKRTKSETKLLEKASKIINVPLPLNYSPHGASGRDNHEIQNKIFLPFIHGKKLSEHLNNFTLEKQKKICREIGSSVAKLHKENIIHGDLTTSNMILVEQHMKSFSSLIALKKSVSEANEIKGGGRGRGGLGNRPEIFFIDFGLGYISSKTEDKAVDLYLLKQALESKHFMHWKILFEEVLSSYKETRGKIEAEKTFERIKAIEKRGRYRH